MPDEGAEEDSGHPEAKEHADPSDPSHEDLDEALVEEVV